MSCSKKTNQSVLHQTMRRDSLGYMPGLDGLRALAVFAVIAYHLNLSWAPGGLLGVSLFFVLSGYLITNILLTQWERSGIIDLKNFWLRRARRLLPALFVMLAGVMFWIAVFSPERLGALKQEVLAATFYTSNWYLIFHHVSYFEQFGPPSPLGHLWSLAVEEQFYLFWPLLLGLSLRCFPQRRWVIGGTAAIALISAAAMALIYIPGFDPSRVYYGTDTRAFALLVGAVLALAWPSRKMSADLSGKRKLVLDTAGSMGLLTVLWMIGKTNQYQTFLYQGGLLIFSVAAAVLVASLAHPAGHLGRIFGWGPLRWLGECSYGIYLWHYPIIVLTSSSVNTEGSDLLHTSLQILASIVLAALSRYLIEEPIRYGIRKKTRRPSSALQWRRRLLGHSAKISLSFVLIFFVLFMTANENTESVAEGLTERQTASQQNQECEQQIQTADQQTAPLQQIQTTVQQGRSTGEGIEEIKGDEITVIGDSIMIDTEPVLQKRLPGIVIDAKIGRQMHQARDVISRLQKEGKLRKMVIIELGSNGSFTAEQLTKILDSLNEIEQIVLVNTRVPKPWETVVNETLYQVAEADPQIKLIDWYTASSGHDDYFYPDGVHLNPTGAEAYGELIVEAITTDEENEV